MSVTPPKRGNDASASKPPGDSALSNNPSSSSSSLVQPGTSLSPHSLPPAILRLLSLSSPVINGIHDLIQLATWTGPHGGGTRSTLLLISWTGICLYTYPLLRYAPQAILLAVILGSAVPNLLLPSSSKKGASRRTVTAMASVPTLTASTLTQSQTVVLLQKLSDILDVCATLHAHVVLPAWQALTWQHPGGASVTMGAAVMCLSLGTLWTLCFADWPVAWATVRATLPLDGAWGLTRQGSALVYLTAKDTYDARLKAKLVSSLPPAVIGGLVKAYTTGEQIWSRAPALPSALPVSLFPPFPLFSLNLSHFFLAIGLIAFSWCSTYATLIRYALWKSATIRKTVRLLLRLVSFGFLGEHDYLQAARLASLGPSSGLAKSSQATTSTGKDAQGKKNVRINSVSYRFELYENQRWWMGLDWTAALLPQERASWTDGNLAPVSPPSSFTLPAETVTMRPAPTKSNPKAWEKRTVRWTWEEEEWKVVVHGGGINGFALSDGEGNVVASTPSKRSESFSASSAAASTASPSPSTGGTLFSSFTKTRSPSMASLSSDNPASSLEGLGPNQSGAAGQDDDLLSLDEDTDALGWRYGDNSWDKMGSKSGMGKYTRRRRWIRRAVMEEIVESGLDKPDDRGVSGSGSASASGSSGNSKVTVQKTEGNEEQARSESGSKDKTGVTSSPSPSLKGDQTAKIKSEESSSPTTIDAAKEAEAKGLVEGAADATDGKGDLKSQSAQASK